VETSRKETAATTVVMAQNRRAIETLISRFTARSVLRVPHGACHILSFVHINFPLRQRRFCSMMRKPASDF
jgi:hypothetical protein